MAPGPGTVVDFSQRRAELERNPNPMALVVMAHLKTKITRDDAAKRLDSKVDLRVRLFSNGPDLLCLQ